MKAICLAEAVNYCLQSDDSDLDSSVGSLSSDEEEKLVNYYCETIPLTQTGSYL